MQITQPVVFNFGFAHGNETFSALLSDRLGTVDSLRTIERLRRASLLDESLRTIVSLERFEASTYSGGVDFKLTPGLILDLNFSYQERTDGSSQSTFGVGVTIRQ